MDVLMIILGTFILGLVIGILMRRIQYLADQRTFYYDALLKEHRRWHRCNVGLGLDAFGHVEHFFGGNNADT